MTPQQSIKRLDQWALTAGITGFTSVVAGVAWINGPAALIVAGLGLIGWSYLTARAVSVARQATGQSPS